MAGKSRASFVKSSRERDKRRKREEKLQRKLERRHEAKLRESPEFGDAVDASGVESGEVEPPLPDENPVEP